MRLAPIDLADRSSGTTTAVQRTDSTQGCYAVRLGGLRWALTTAQVCPGLAGHPRSTPTDVSSSLGDTSSFLRCFYYESSSGTGSDFQCGYGARSLFAD